jgi:hypothetical protein
LRSYDVVKGKGDSAKTLVEIIEAYPSDCDDGKTRAEGEDYEQFGEETHLQGVD